MYNKEKVRFLPDPDIKVRTMTYDIVSEHFKTR